MGQFLHDLLSEFLFSSQQLFSHLLAFSISESLDGLATLGMLRLDHLASTPLARQRQRQRFE